jgi:hypothetical protein
VNDLNISSDGIVYEDNIQREEYKCDTNKCNIVGG